jgi:hypothetical protein
MNNQTTCGQGLAANSLLPATMAEVMASISDILELHTQALDIRDANSKREREVYQDLVRGHREAAAQLRALASHMAGSRDLPMGKHDLEAMTAPHVVRAFEQFVQAEHELLALLQPRVEQDRQMLDEMRAANTPG